MRDELQDLRDIRDLLEPPQNWIQGWSCRAKDMRPASGACGSDAVCWCLGGAVMRIHGAPIWIDLHIYAKPVWTRLRRLAEKRGFDSVQEFNDDENTSHLDVLALVDEAIAEVISERTARG